jgi:diaminopimelate epimerase
MTLKYAKYQALGNSFIVLDDIRPTGHGREFEGMARSICSQATGVGADGLLIVSRKQEIFAVDVYNADGSWAEKSGNGIRIAAMHLLNKELISGKTSEVETGSGTCTIGFHRGNDKRRIISATLGAPIFEADKIPVTTTGKYFINQPVTCDNKSYVASAVSIGNPHLVLFCEDFDFDWQTIGRVLESDPIFPNRINVGFVVAHDEANIEVRDWERGVGPTQSSGTGAAAAVALAVMRGFTDRVVTVQTQAGELDVSWDDKSDQLAIKGPVEFIAAGEIDL